MEILIKSIVISLSICGLRIVSSKGMILYFLRKPFENTTGWKNYLAKPFILCVTCMSSIWTIAIDYFYYGNMDKWTILTIFVVSALNAVIYATYKKIIS